MFRRVRLYSVLPWCCSVAVVLSLLLPARGVIMRLTPLREVLSGEQFIFVAKVQTLDPDKPTAILTVEETLKGKPPFTRLPINLAGDSESQKNQHTEQLLKRLSPELPVVVFTSQRGKRYTAFAFSNGTWFQLLGQADEKPETVRWSFLHCEPYLRRTFKGTTAELRQIVIDGLADKQKPPEPDPKEPPGLGPEIVEKAKLHKETGAEPKTDKKGSRGVSGGPVFGVIPTVAIGGPLAILAILFPAVFGGALVVMRRWLIFLTVTGINSTLYFLHGWFAAALHGTMWGSTQTLWVTMTVIAGLGALASFRRHRAHRVAVAAGVESPTPTRRGEQIVLWLMALGSAGLLGYCLWSGHSGLLLLSPWKDTLAFGIAVWVGSLYLLWLGRRQPQATTVPVTLTPAIVPVFAGETVVLGTLFLAMIGLVGARPTSRTAAGACSVAWSFQADDPGFFASSPLLDGERIYIGAAHNRGLSSWGSIYCLNNQTGEKVWSFDNDGEMKPVFSSPRGADGRLFVGEGFHQDKECKFYCLDITTGKKVWEFATTSHTESTPCVAGVNVYFGAGDDGLFCLNASTGAVVWHFEKLHVDTAPAVANGRVYAGSGVGDLYTTPVLFCLDALTGKEQWRTPSELPVFGSPTLFESKSDGRRVVFGLGNGDFIKSAEHPAGAVLCLDADTGKRLWQVDARDGVHGKPAVDEHGVYFGARDGFLYAVDRSDGRLHWKQNFGSPVVASATATAGAVIAVGSGGLVHGFRANDGKPLWPAFDVGEQSQLQPQLLSSPATLTDSAGQRLIYFGAGMDNLINKSAVLYCVREPGRE